MVHSTKDGAGYFVFSLDTELAWGYFHLDKARTRLFSADGSRERKTIVRLLDILDGFNIVGTWAIVGHLLYEQCERCEWCPILEWQGKYESFEEVYQTNASLWYGADIVETLLARGSQHEIAFHGYIHEPFDEHNMDQERTRLEIQEGLRVFRRIGITPQSVIFPQNIIGHLDAFKASGFVCYRSQEASPRFGALAKSIDHILALSTPPVYTPVVERSGLVDCRPSQHFFGFNRKLESVLDTLHLHKLRINRMIKGVRKAALEKKYIHIWAHPWEFRTDKDFAKLCYLLDYVSEEIGKGKMRSVGMTELSQIALEQHRFR